MGFCSKKCWLVCGLIAFAIITILSGLIYIITNPLVEEGLKEEFIVDSEESEGFVYWACKYSLFDAGVCAEEHDSVVFNEAYFVFNLTNVDEVLQGGKPVFEEFGPYFYLVDIVKYDIEFVDDGNQVEYGEARAYYFNPEKSCAGCLPTDEFVGINAGYLGAVDTAGSETLLLLGMGGPVIGKMLQDISSTYVQSLIDADGFDFWLNKCKEIDAECETQFDMAMVQWGYYWKKGRNSTIGLNNLPVNDWNSEIFPAPEAEFSAFSSSLLSITPLNLTQCKLLLYGTKGIVEGPLYLLELLEAALDPEYLAETWGLNTIELANFGRYILSLSDTYDLYLFEDVTVLEQGGGLFSKRSVHQWVFHFEDPLLKYMQPRDPQTAIRYNDTSVEDARSYKPGKMAIFTGKNDFRNVANVTMWNGTTILDFWEEPVPVFGNNQDGQFFLQLTDGKGKLPSPLEDYDIFSPDHGKTIYLADIGQTLETSTGIRLHRYVLRNETYDPNPIYFQTLPGFINASFHMNPPFRKRIEFGAYVPLFLSQPRFWAIESDLVDKVQINTVPNLEECATIVDVEPISGNAMGAYKRLQVNFYFSANSTSTFGRFHSNMTNDVMYPVLFISQEITVTPELEDEWNTALGGILNIIDYIFIIGLIVGSVGFVCCLLGLIILNKRQEGYKAIN